MDDRDYDDDDDDDDDDYHYYYDYDDHDDECDDDNNYDDYDDHGDDGNGDDNDDNHDDNGDDGMVMTMMMIMLLMVMMIMMMTNMFFTSDSHNFRASSYFPVDPTNETFPNLTTENVYIDFSTRFMLQQRMSEYHSGLRAYLEDHPIQQVVNNHG